MKKLTSPPRFNLVPYGYEWQNLMIKTGRKRGRQIYNRDKQLIFYKPNCNILFFNEFDIFKIGAKYIFIVNAQKFEKNTFIKLLEYKGHMGQYGIYRGFKGEMDFIIPNNAEVFNNLHLRSKDYKINGQYESWAIVEKGKVCIVTKYGKMAQEIEFERLRRNPKFKDISDNDLRLCVTQEKWLVFDKGNLENKQSLTINNELEMEVEVL